MAMSTSVSGTPAPVFQGTSLSSSDENSYYRFLSDVHHIRWFRHKEADFLTNVTTHLIVGDLKGGHNSVRPRTPKLLAAIASGRVWILPELYLEDAMRQRELPDPVNYEADVLAPDYYLPPFRERRLRGGIFSDKKIAIIIPDPTRKKAFSDIVTAGGGSSMPWTVLHLANAKDIELAQLHLVVVDPALAKTRSFHEFIKREGLRCPTVSPAYLEEVLTSGQPISANKFDVRSNGVQDVHARTDIAALGGDRWHETSLLGTPTIGACPQAVSTQLNLPDRIPAPRINHELSFIRPPSPPPQPSVVQKADALPLSAQLVNVYLSTNGCMPDDPEVEPAIAGPSNVPHPTSSSSVMDNLIRSSCKAALANDPLGTKAPILTDQGRTAINSAKDKGMLDSAVDSLLLEMRNTRKRRRLSEMMGREEKQSTTSDNEDEDAMIQRVIANTTLESTPSKEKKKHKKDKKRDKKEKRKNKEKASQSSERVVNEYEVIDIE